MKVAVAAAGPDLDSAIDPRFGRCRYFVVVDTETMAFEALENTAAMQGSGAGIAAAQLVARAGAEAVIAANLGPKAFDALKAGEMTAFGAETGSVREAVEALKAGSLPELGSANVASHTGMAQQPAGQASSSPAGATGNQLKGKVAELEAQMRDLKQQLQNLETKR
jgi:predicted Fe-Mo cluster-binding NifX family protein